MFITNTQLHATTPAQVNTYTPYTHPCDYNYLATPEDVEAYERALDAEDEAWFEENVEENEDLFAPQDQRHFDRLSYLAVNELLNVSPSSWDLTLDTELYNVIHSTLRLENALDIRDIWS